MRIASYNVENLFDRAKALNTETFDNGGDDSDPWAGGRRTLQLFAELNALLRNAVYSDADKALIVQHLRELGLARSDESDLVILRRNRGQLVRRRQTGEIEVVADGRADWIGWLELKTEAVNEVATLNTARIVREVGADVLVVVEADNRISLLRFNEQLIARVGGQPYDQVMLVDGNDERGIDVGLFARSTVRIDHIRSHVDDRNGASRIFSRDCPEYHLETAGGAPLIVLANHFKSKGGGAFAASNARRLKQAERVRDIYKGLRAAGHANVVVAGDLNDTPGSAPLAPLISGTDLRDISLHPSFDDGGRPGTFGNGTAANKIDYLLLSPALFALVSAGGIDRRGVWGGKNGTLFPHLPEITREAEAASDHAAIWAELDL